ncbi:hypothetical protein [Nocardia farcinica]|uniref:hypothetical protein n=1 Tax=Nocardia farcinica TaxID=37329 RepID=UPI00189428A4|nr:hypothetical protein [Nocardia farcinica]MBF6253967.1 hypothetical protein [Nocardia farcinica]
MADAKAGPEPNTLAAAVAETIAAWRAQNPTDQAIPRRVRREISRAVRNDTRSRQLDVSITRTQLELDILHHQKAVIAAGFKPEKEGQHETWARKQAELSDAATRLERRIHELPHLSATDRGRVVEALAQAHAVPGAAVRVKWEVNSAMEALKARVAEKVSAIRLGITTVTRQLRSAPFRLAQWQADAMHNQARQPEGPSAWLTPGQAAALADLTAAAQRFDKASTQAREAKEAETDLAAVVTEFHEALTRTQQLGITSDRINQELRAAHQASQTEPHRQGMWSKIQAAARGPLTPPAAAATGGREFTFGAAPAAQAAPVAAAARRAAR